MTTVKITLDMPINSLQIMELNQISDGKASEILDELINSGTFKQGMGGILDGLIHDWILQNKAEEGRETKTLANASR